MCLEDNRNEVVAFGTFDLLEGLNILVFGAVHDGKDFCGKMLFIARPMTTGTGIKWFQKDSSFKVNGPLRISRHRPGKTKLDDAF